MKKIITKTQKLGLIYIILMFVFFYLGLEKHNPFLLLVSLFLAVASGYKLRKDDVERGIK